MKIGGQLFAHPHLGIDAAHARELHLVFITVGSVQAMQPLHRLVVLVVDQAAHRQQGRAHGHIQVTCHFDVCQTRRNRLLGTPDLDTGLFKEHQNGFTCQLTLAEISGNCVWDPGRDVRQRSFGRAAHPFGFLDKFTRGQSKGLGHILGSLQGTDRQHFDRRVQTHGHQVFQQTGQPGGLA